ncbi:hypothetical protein K458DRAFT_407770 [Lentithecium fluviatile CBS 122367]|uniref:Uncharacterized protein n=1 Tax=Lentithecium fluviatile CBS 122367 TaxID=1168545 RepID=A0A6G1IPL4_9PLEO|nr:hypothetical protein K458DRAFT_407770 [Lentithecium fluviatile CBS 122367]
MAQPKYDYKAWVAAIKATPLRLRFEKGFPEDQALRDSICATVENAGKESLVRRWGLGLVEERKPEGAFPSPLLCTKTWHQGNNQHITLKMRWQNEDGIEIGHWGSAHLHKDYLETVTVFGFRGLPEEWREKQSDSTVWTTHPPGQAGAPAPTSTPAVLPAATGFLPAPLPLPPTVPPMGRRGHTGQNSWVYYYPDAVTSRRAPTPPLPYDEEDEEENKDDDEELEEGEIRE